MTPPLLNVIDLKKHFPVRAGLFGAVREHVKAVDGVSFSIDSGKTLGLVGESGCGKTTVGRALLRLIAPTSGKVEFEGTDILKLGRRELREKRRRMQIVFQDPYGSLNPRMTIQQILGEALEVHGLASGNDLRAEVARLLSQVGLRPEVMNRYPHEFSGGQRQRIGIARALALQPAFIVCDEPTSALDVSIRAQIINLLQDLQAARGLSYLMISHDLGVVRHISDAVAVMYLGKIVEQAPTEALYENPRHPYTQILLSAIPVPNPRQRAVRAQQAKPLDADDAVPSPINIPSGCPFHPRCPLYVAQGQPAECRTKLPDLVALNSDPAHLLRCHFAAG
ncbi:MAG: ATP-binding cassette domain-containing protein [Planctomycetes bacterium]|nr:ATP-binding cassette domain-containing protein [Planctomycetota bacterium]